MAYCAYLRKSRADMDAEARGEGETLARHQKMLFDLAKRMNIFVSTVYKEIVSGETIAARPVMQHLLTEVEQCLWEGVLVVEIERLARGDTIDQGTVARAFQISGTKIITPMKVYDPSNEFDEEYFEFNLFMSRREYKTINRRIQRGRIASVMEGKYISPEPPYGYSRVKIPNDKGYTLVPHPEESAAVKFMFHTYTEKRLGSHQIALRLTKLGYTPKGGGSWSPSSVRDILKNPVYCGMNKWGERAEVKTIVNGQITKHRIYNPDHILVKALWDGLVTKETWDAAQAVRKGNLITCNFPSEEGLQNPLAGILVCGSCGKVMQRQYQKKKNQIRIICGNPHCSNISSTFDFVEDVMIDCLKIWLKTFKLKYKSSHGAAPESSALKDTATRLKKEQETILGQVSKLHDLLEQGVYDTETFLKRNGLLSARLQEIKKSMASIDRELKIQKKQIRAEAFIPMVENVINAYHTLESNEEKNQLLKSVLKKVTYVKTEKGKGLEKAFTLEIYPIIES